MKAVTKEERRVAYPLVLIFAILSLGIVVGGTFYYRHYEQQFRTEVEGQLSAVAELKGDELAQYRKERLWDAGAFFKNTAFSGLVRRFLDHPEDAEAQQQLQDWAAKYLATGQYDQACLFDAQGVTRMSVPTGRPAISSVVSRRIPEVLRSGQVTLQDFHRNEHDQQVYLTLLVPILDGVDHSQALGVLALRINPETYLYPFIKRWPTPSRTVETLLVRRDGNDALFLNELKFGTNTALNLRISIENTNVAAVKAVLGEKGIAEGVDYRGIPVVAALSAIPDSPWFLVARMDAAEVYAPLRERLLLTVLLVGTLLTGVSAGAGAIWRHQRAQFYKERSQVAEALRESEERFRRIFEEGPIGMAMLDETFRFIQVNPAFSSMLGYSMEEMRTMTFPDITHPDYVQRDVEQVRRLLRGELSVYRTEKRYVAKSGKELWGLVQVGVVRNADGAFRHFLVIISDITERKQAEVTGRENEERLRSHTDNSPLAVIEWNADLIITQWTGAAEKMFGWKAEEAIGKPIAELPGIYEEDLPAVQSVIRQLAGGVSKQVFSSNRNRTRNGQVIHCEWYNSVLHDARGKMTSVLSQVLDVTVRQRAEEALRASENRLRTLVQTIPDLVWLKDTNGVFLSCNTAFERLFGAGESSIVGKTDYDFVEKSLADFFRQRDQAAMAADEPTTNEEWLTFAHDGYRGLFQTIKTPMRDADGALVGVLGVARDITERKRAEEALRESQALHRSLVEQMPAGIFRKDPEGRYVLVNSWFCQLRGMKAEEILGKTPEELIAVELAKHGEIRPEITQLLTEGTKHHERIMRNGERIEVEEEYPAVDGRKRYLRVVKSPVFDPAGKIIGTQGVQFDITEIKRAEAALWESQALYFSLVEQLPVGVFRKDPAGRYVLVNPWFCRLKSMKAEEFLGKTPEEVAASEAAKQDPTGRAGKYAAAGRDHHGQIMQTGKPIELVEEYTDADGREQFVHALKLPVFDPDRKIIGTQGILFDITEIKQAAEALHHEQTLMATLMKTLPDPVYFKDAASRFLRVNPALARKLGLDDPAQAVGKTDADFFTEEHASKALADEQEIIRTGQPLVNIEEKETWPNGSETWVLTTKLPLRDDAGRIIGTCGISSNITARKRAEEVLRLSEERLLKVITQTRCILNSGQVEGPENWRERALNPETPFRWDFPVQNEETAQKIFPLELAAGERYQQAWTRSRNHADHTQMNWSSGNAFLNDLPFYRNEFRCIDKHGAGHWMQQFVTVRKLAENRWQVFGVTTDISDLKRVEAELRRSETGLQATLESTTDGILAVDNKGKVIKANRRFAELWRIPQSLMDAGDDRVLLDFVLKQLSDPDAFLKKVQLLYSTDAVEMDMLAFKDGRIFERYTSPMKMEGAVIGRVWSFRDITERKRQEEELKQKNSELERFTYTVSHDLKSPLVTVNTFLGYLEQDLARPDMERVKQDVAYMHTATKKMGQLLDELLNLARVGRKKNPAVRVTFRELAQEAVRLVAGRISTGGVKVQVADAVVTLEGDRPRLMEIWQNLVENACKFMGNQPQPQVEIGVEQRGPETVFFVRDNGAGIDPRYQAKVFGLFEQLNPKGEGTGMGLALVKRIVELYEGRIWVESAGPGQGANFLFTLPGAVIIDPEQSS